MFSNTSFFHAVSSCKLAVGDCALNLDILSRSCPEQPAIEITRIVDVDIATGEVSLPSNLR